jgi:hypothetical protein
MILWEIIHVYSENLMKHKNTSREGNTEFLNVIPSGMYEYSNIRTLKGYRGHKIP